MIRKEINLGTIDKLNKQTIAIKGGQRKAHQWIAY